MVAQRRIIMHAFVDNSDYNAQNLNAREICLRLDPERFQITLFYQDAPDERLADKNNINLIKVPKNRYLASLVVLKHLLSPKYDIYLNVRVFLVDYLYLKVAKIMALKKVTIHHIENTLPYPNKNKYYNKIAKSNALNCDFIFSVSKYVAETAQSEYGIVTPVVYVGVDTNVFLPLIDDNRRNENQVKILYVGSLQERKRPDYVLKAAKEFPDAVFEIVGTGPLLDKLIYEKEKENIRNLSIIGGVSKGELINKYQNADIFLFPSYHEGFPKVTLEAASCGLPVIVFKDYKPETLIDGVTGFTVDSYEDMLEKLDELIKNPDLRIEMGKMGRNYVQKFDWNEIVKRWETHLSTIRSI
ncbi:glycosyltransferase family 4 protein [Methanofollis formosanus]|nr:glycosyltransferase family 4 protein [Methanofollis formosanus]